MRAFGLIEFARTQPELQFLLHCLLFDELDQMDNVDARKRHQIMSAVKSKNTGPELCLRRELHRRGFRYRLHVKDLAGSPDIVWRSRKKVIFVHGCFWHGHVRCRHARLPRSNTQFWKKKLVQNQARDQRILDNLGEQGWRVLIVWQCELRDMGACMRNVVKFLGPRRAP